MRTQQRWRVRDRGMPVKMLCRKGSFSGAAFCEWHSKFGGMDVPDARRLEKLEGDNAKFAAAGAFAEPRSRFKR